MGLQGHLSASTRPCGEHLNEEKHMYSAVLRCSVDALLAAFNGELWSLLLNATKRRKRTVSSTSTGDLGGRKASLRVPRGWTRALNLRHLTGIHDAGVAHNGRRLLKSTLNCLAGGSLQELRESLQKRQKRSGQIEQCGDKGQSFGHVPYVQRRVKSKCPCAASTKLLAGFPREGLIRARSSLGMATPWSQ